MRSPLRSPAFAVALAAFLGIYVAARPGGGQPAPSSVPPAAPAETTGSAAPKAPPATAQRKAIDPSGINDAVRSLAADVQKWGGSVGVVVLDVATGETLASTSPHSAFNPASNQKLFTAAAALRVLGPQHRFLTGLYGRVSGARGDSVDELVLRGQGDPSLETRDLWDLARDLRSAGIRRVGSIGVDQTYFDDVYVPPAFDEQPNEWAPFRAPVAAVSLNRNTVLFTVRPSELGKGASITVDPPGFVDIVGSVRTTAKGDPEKITMAMEPRDARLGAKVGGTLPSKSRPVQIAKRVDDPRLLAGYALRAALKDAGVETGGDVHLTGKQEKTLLAAHRSAPLGGLLAALGKESDNFYAEMLLKVLGAQKKGVPATSEGGAEVTLRVLRDAGAFEEGVIIKNGSGLFNANRATPWSTAMLLRTIHGDPALGPEFMAHLSIGGVDGTLQARFRSWRTSRAIRAKTGTLDAVASLSGYVLAPSGGSPIAFSILVNGISGKVSDARRSIDKVVDATALELWKAHP